MRPLYSTCLHNHRENNEVKDIKKDIEKDIKEKKEKKKKCGYIWFLFSVQKLYRYVLFQPGIMG